MLKTVSSITNAIGALNYKGTWNASTNTPTLASGVGTKGDYYVVSVAGSTTLDGISNWGVGDWAAYNGSVWQRVEGGADGNFVNLSVSSTSTLSGLTASTALALDASKNVVSVTNTGTGSNVLSNSPTLTTPTLAGATLSGTVAGGGNQINDVVIGTSTPLAGSFTTLAASTSISLTNTGPNPIARLKSTAGLGAFRGPVLLFAATTNDTGPVQSDLVQLFGYKEGGATDTKGAFSIGVDNGSGIQTRLEIASTGIHTMGAYGAGAATFSAAGVISSVSDETWKRKDGVPANPDAMLQKLKPGYWYYNDEKKETFGSERQLGFYAQNVNAAIGPEAAPAPTEITKLDKTGTQVGTGEFRPWGYYDRSVLAVTVMSLQKALKTIELLTARVAALEAK